MILKANGSGAHVRVTFQVPDAIWAETMHLVGDFNGWNRHSHPMVHSRDGQGWEITLELRKGKSFQFRYLINGTEWQNDWHADRYVPNPFGGDNSVVET